MSKQKRNDPWLILAVSALALAVIVVLSTLGVSPK